MHAKIPTNCREEHVVQKQSDEDDEEDELSRLSPGLEAFDQLRRQPRRIMVLGHHCRRFGHRLSCDDGSTQKRVSEMSERQLARRCRQFKRKGDVRSLSVGPAVVDSRINTEASIVGGDRPVRARVAATTTADAELHRPSEPPLRLRCRSPTDRCVRCARKSSDDWKRGGCSAELEAPICRSGVCRTASVQLLPVGLDRGVHSRGIPMGMGVVLGY